MANVKVERQNDKTYVRCSICNETLVTDDSEYFLGKVSKNELRALGGCSHFEVIEVHKDEKSLQKLSMYEQNAVAKFENKRYVIVITPRQS